MLAGVAFDKRVNAFFYLFSFIALLREIVGLTRSSRLVGDRRAGVQGEEQPLPGGLRGRARGPGAAHRLRLASARQGTGIPAQLPSPASLISVYSFPRQDLVGGMPQKNTIEMRRKSSNPSAKDVMSPKVLDIIRRNSWADYALHEFATRLVENRPN